MSSHHFVREDQEPALVVLSGSEKAYAHTQPLLEWSPLVIVTEEALEQVLTWGVKIDVIIAREEHKPDLLQRLTFFGPLKFVWRGAGEDSLTLALHFLLASKQRYVNIVTDHELFQQLDSWMMQLHIVIHQKDFRWSAIISGRFEKWLPANYAYVVREASGAREKFTTTQEGIIRLQRDAPFWFGEEVD